MRHIKGVFDTGDGLNLDRDHTTLSVYQGDNGHWYAVDDLGEHPVRAEFYPVTQTQFGVQIVRDDTPDDMTPFGGCFLTSEDECKRIGMPVRIECEAV